MTDFLTTPLSVPAVPPAPADAAEKAEKLEKALRKADAERGPLSPADRYKALVNAVKHSQDLIELGDRKARFALVIMSVLNAVAVLLVAQGGSELFPTVVGWRVLLGVEGAVYLVVTVYYIGQAIAALRPRGVALPKLSDLPHAVVPGTSMRVLFHADAAARSREDYRALWGAMRMDNLTAELTDHLHTLSLINQRKYEALDRLYLGLRVMKLWLALFLGTLALYHLIG